MGGSQNKGPLKKHGTLKKKESFRQAGFFIFFVGGSQNKGLFITRHPYERTLKGTLL